MKHIVHVGAGGEKGSNKEYIYHYFEPREDKTLSSITQGNVNIYPFALLDYKGAATLNITEKVGCSSFLEPNLDLLKKLQPSNWNRFKVKEQVEIPVDRLDNIITSDIEIKKLIIDTQGSELSVLKGCGALLKKVEYIVCEVEYVELYRNQPLYPEIVEYLTKFGFKPDGFIRKVSWREKTPVFADARFLKQ